MTDVPPAPAVDVPDGWVETQSTSEQVFAVSKVTVTATTVVYEDETLHEAVESALGGGFRRFAFASRIQLKPLTKPSKPLTKLVTSRAKAGFSDRLSNRGMETVTEKETRRFRIVETEATLVRYETACVVEGTRLAVDGWVAVWPDNEGNGDYFVAGGAYPTSVLEGANLSAAIDPGRFRDDLFSIVRSVR